MTIFKNSIFKFILILGMSMPAVFYMTGGIVLVAYALPTGGGSTAASLETQKQVLIAIADAAIKKLDAAENAIQSNSVLSAATKQTTIAVLQGAEDQLISYKAQIAQATTAAEIQALNQQLVGYLQANKTVIAEAFKAAFTEIGAAAAVKAEEFEAMVEQTIKLLKIACPQQIATLSALEDQLDALEIKIEALKAAVAAKDSAAIRQIMSEISALIKSMSANIKIIEAECDIPV